MTVDLVFRRDRFSRGGDHTSFVRDGFGAVRFTTPSENYANQHTATDTFEHASVPYTTRVAKVNAAVLASLALAPKPPVVQAPPGAREEAGAARHRVKLESAVPARLEARPRMPQDGPLPHPPSNKRGVAERWPTGLVFRVERADTMRRCAGQTRIRSRILPDTPL